MSNRVLAPVGAGRVALTVSGGATALVADTSDYTRGTTSKWGSFISIDPTRGWPRSLSCPSVSFCASVDDSGRATFFDGSSGSAPVPTGRASNQMCEIAPST